MATHLLCVGFLKHLHLLLFTFQHLIPDRLAQHHSLCAEQTAYHKHSHAAVYIVELAWCQYFRQVSILLIQAQYTEKKMRNTTCDSLNTLFICCISNKTLHPFSATPEVLLKKRSLSKKAANHPLHGTNGPGD